MRIKPHQYSWESLVINAVVTVFDFVRKVVKITMESYLLYCIFNCTKLQLELFSIDVGLNMDVFIPY